MADLGLFRIRPLLTAQVPGTVSFSPFGSNTRAIVITVDPDRLRAHNFTPEDVVTALETGNLVVPSGNLYAAVRCRWCRPTPWSPTRRKWAIFPLSGRERVHPRRGHDSRHHGHQLWLRPGQRPPVDVHSGGEEGHGFHANRGEQIHDSLPLFKSVVPEDVDVRYEFDESPTVRAAIKSVAIEGMIGAALTGLMILLFLHDLRSVVVVLVSIPLSLTTSLVALWLTGNTINIMSLGGLALAIGILVDEATVTIENTHAQMRERRRLPGRHGGRAATTATARLLAMLCILSVFIPTFILNEPVRSLFMPLTLAVGFAMIASYLLSSTLVPVLSVWLIRHGGQPAHKKGLFDRVLPPFARIVESTARRRWIVVPAYLVGCGLLFWLVGREVGTELFPEVDTGQFVLRFRSSSRFRIRADAQVRAQNPGDHRQAKRRRVAMSMGYVGLGATNTATNNILLFMRATDDGSFACGCKSGAASGSPELRERLRKVLPEQVVPWLKGVLEQQGHSRRGPRPGPGSSPWASSRATSSAR